MIANILKYQNMEINPKHDKFFMLIQLKFFTVLSAKLDLELIFSIRDAY